MDVLTRSTKFLAMSLYITSCAGSSRNAVLVLGENSNSTLYRLSIKDNANRAILVENKANLLMVEVNLENNEVSNHGAAMFVNSNSHISIINSNFKGTLQQQKEIHVELMEHKLTCGFFR